VAPVVAPGDNVNAPRPLVSVVIPVYGGARFVGEAIASVLAHSSADVEVVAVDDASPDESAAVVASIGDARVRLLRHERNRGIAAARNTGLAAARGDLVAFLDQDDVWLSGRLHAQRAELDRRAAEGVGLVFSAVTRRESNGRERLMTKRVPERVHELEGGTLLARLLADNFVVLGSALIRRSVVDAAGAFDETIRGGSDDFDMILRCAEHCRFAYLPQALFVHREHGANYTDSRRMTDESLAVIDRVQRRHPELARAADIGRARALYRRAADSQLAGDRRAAVRDYRRVLSYRALVVRACAGLALCAAGPLGDAIGRAWMRARRGP